MNPMAGSKKNDNNTGKGTKELLNLFEAINVHDDLVITKLETIDFNERIEFRQLSSKPRNRIMTIEKYWSCICYLILNWRKSLISQIEESINEQKHLLDQEYENQRHHLEKNRQEYIGETLIHKKEKNDE